MEKSKKIPGVIYNEISTWPRRPPCRYFAVRYEPLGLGATELVPPELNCELVETHCLGSGIVGVWRVPTGQAVKRSAPMPMCSHLQQRKVTDA